ncbi:TetR/AcrR family transcriptional regulator [Flavobacterium alkalisoli]|uniref:TetR/AcrR family transcriptional regulator n=1 Tax=Flavobacterium alkalisoli TaxID=2602769 RepID=A0A5B9FXZ0_9FLAO|nr:TetR family transcriptional regulator [Flavobacterium alkalisoli]QEE51211.1 TetR/AcrR family transcriptional regulator [Flavobacterium alkalisoli]QEE51212.1 TetR/AcrR family transcriptional regulator [Flavobacterium alkalisoli]QEE51228.1 TetR/AcrR family transcriptional regulator [Flavobacterium alkalisoli]
MTEYNDKQLEILKAAEILFASEGFDGTSIRSIAKAAKVNIAMISYYFGSKEKMLEALIIYRTSDMRMQLDIISKEDLTPSEKVDRLIDLYISRINKNKCMYQILHFELSTKKRIMDMKAFTDVKRQNMEAFTKIINEGQEQGIFRKDVNINLIPPTIMGTLVHFQMNRPFFEAHLGISTDEAYENYIENELTIHIKQTIKALLVHEN